MSNTIGLHIQQLGRAGQQAVNKSWSIPKYYSFFLFGRQFLTFHIHSASASPTVRTMTEGSIQSTTQLTEERGLWKSLIKQRTTEGTPSLEWIASCQNFFGLTKTEKRCTEYPFTSGQPGSIRSSMYDTSYEHSWRKRRRRREWGYFW